MITTYVVVDTNYVMSPELFGPTSVLPRIRDHFARKTKGNSIIISDEIYQAFCNNKPIPDHHCIVISERLFRIHQQPNDRFVEAEGITIVTGFQAALSIASNGRKDTTILGTPSLLEETIMVRQVYEKMFLITVHGVFPGIMQFPKPLIDYYKLIDPDEWPRDNDNPYDIQCNLYYKRG